MPLLGALPGILAGVLTPGLSLGDIRKAVHPNAYRTAMPSQVAIAGAATPRGALRGGIFGGSGSEADYPQEQASGNATIGAPIDHITAGLTRRAPMPSSWYVPHLPGGLIEGRGTGPQTGAYNKGWVRLRIGGGRGWGATTRDTAPSIKKATLLVPTDRTPLPRDVAAGFDSSNKGHTRLMDKFGD